MKRIAFGFAVLLILGACAETAPAQIAPSQTALATNTLPAIPSSTSSPTVTPTIPEATETPAIEFPLPIVALRSIAVGLDKPVFLTHAGDGSGRLFLVEKPGRILILKKGVLLPEPFLDIRSQVKSTGNEQGLLGLAFDPKYVSNGRFFVNYIDTDGNTVVARYLVTPDNPDRADPASGTALLHIAQPYPNHNGGDLAFGPDGYLYIGMGDGGSAGDPQGNGQRLETLLGKILRIDVRGDAYAIPADNPFAGQADARPEIWAYGLRNPWRFSFDRMTGDLYIGDVGQDTYEEIDFQPAGSAGGQNYGWNLMEGFHPYHGSNSADLVPPVAEYDHSNGNCSVTGGYVYRGSRIPTLTGTYIFGDYCTGQAWVLRRFTDGWRMAEWFGMQITISSFGEGEDGELYVLDYRSGAAFALDAG
jgi:glucose/arabinose dehydrogenase